MTRLTRKGTGPLALAGRMKPYLWIALVLFLSGAVFGDVEGTRVQALIAPLIGHLRHEATLLRHQPVWRVALDIFVNNVEVSMLMLFGGLLFGIAPVLAVMANGVLVGYVIRLATTKTHLSAVVVIAAGILPHGLFEIPAYLLATALGMRLGGLVVRSLLGKAKGPAWRSAGRDIAPTVAWVVGLLFVAAWIESGVTPDLLHAAVVSHL